MKTSNSRLLIIKGASIGLVTSCIINLWLIASLYNNFSNLIYYSMAVPTAIITYLFLRNKQIKYFIITWIVSIFSFVLVEFLIAKIGIVNMEFRHIYGDFGEMSPGGGFAIMIVYMFNLIGSLIGTVIAFIVTCIKRSHAKKLT